MTGRFARQIVWWYTRIFRNPVPKIGDNMMRNGKVFSFLAGLVFLASSSSSSAQSRNTQEEKPLVPAGPVPDAALLFLGNLQGKIDPCI